MFLAFQHQKQQNSKKWLISSHLKEAAQFSITMEKDSHETECLPIQRIGDVAISVTNAEQEQLRSKSMGRHVSASQIQFIRALWNANELKNNNINLSFFFRFTHFTAIVWVNFHFSKSFFQVYFETNKSQQKIPIYEMLFISSIEIVEFKLFLWHKWILFINIFLIMKQYFFSCWLHNRSTVHKVKTWV